MRRAWIRLWTTGKWFLAVLAALIIGALLIWLDHRFGWTEYGTYKHPQTGDPLWGKSLWDWLDLLIVPVVLAVGGLLFSRAERQAERKAAEQRANTDRELAADRAREAALEDYLDHMSELLLEKELRLSDAESEVRDIARARTYTALRVLDGTRKGLLLRFLHEAGLIQEKRLVNLRQADLSDASLVGADLRGANLRDADLRGACLVWAAMNGANLSSAYLREANLSVAELSRANLSWADLLRADLHLAHLDHADLQGAELQGANLAHAVLQGAKLVSIHLYEADLTGAHLDGADLQNATLREANLRSASLNGADLRGANLEGAELTGAEYGERTILPDGTEWWWGTDMARFTDPKHPDFWRSDDPDSPAYRGNEE
jgi:uncharacterized protein YjbI with pentapeptide repeats